MDELGRESGWKGDVARPALRWKLHSPRVRVSFYRRYVRWHKLWSRLCRNVGQSEQNDDGPNVASLCHRSAFGSIIEGGLHQKQRCQSPVLLNRSPRSTIHVTSPEKRRLVAARMALLSGQVCLARAATPQSPIVKGSNMKHSRFDFLRTSTALAVLILAACHSSDSTAPDSVGALSWTKVSSGTTEHLLGVWGSSVSNAWGVGSGGTILHGSPGG